MPETANPPDFTEDRFTRLWRDADPSRGQYVEAIAGLRERQRLEHEASQPAPRRRSDGRHAAVEGSTLTSRRSPVERIKCERCDHRVLSESVEWVATSSPAGEPVAHLLCPRCAEEVRHGLRQMLAGPQSFPTIRGDQDVPTTRGARMGWFMLRMAVYGLIGLAVFGLVAFSIR